MFMRINFFLLFCFLKYTFSLKHLSYAEENTIISTQVIVGNESAYDKDIQVIYNTSNQIYDFDYNYDNNYILWRDSNAIYRLSNLNFLNNHNFSHSLTEELLLKTNYTYRAKLSIDWIHDLVYFIENERLTVASINDPNNRYIVKDKNVKDIAINPNEYFIVWTEWHFIRMNASLIKSNYDGTNQTILINTDIKEPISVIIDFEDRRIYWIDRQLYTLSSIDYNGFDRQLIIESKYYFQFTLSMDIYDNYIYWSNAISDAILRINKYYNNSHIEVVIESNANINSFKFISKSRQPNNDSLNVCLSTDCTLCLPVSSDRTICPLEQNEQNLAFNYEKLADPISDGCNGCEIALPFSISAIILSIISLFVFSLNMYLAFFRYKNANKTNIYQKVIYEKEKCLVKELSVKDEENGNGNVSKAGIECLTINANLQDESDDNPLISSRNVSLEISKI